MKTSQSFVLAVVLLPLALAVYALHTAEYDAVAHRKAATIESLRIGMTQDEVEELEFDEEFPFFVRMRSLTKGYKLKGRGSNWVVVHYSRDPSWVFRIREFENVQGLLDETDEEKGGEPAPGGIFDPRRVVTRPVE